MALGQICAHDAMVGKRHYIVEHLLFDWPNWLIGVGDLVQVTNRSRWLIVLSISCLQWVRQTSSNIVNKCEGPFSLTC
jgi:hypothetical protein